MTKNLTKGSPMKLIISFAVPLLFGFLFQQFYNLVDTMIVGRFLGVDDLAPADSLQWVKARPNVLLIVLESFSGVAMESLGGIPGVMPNLEKIASEGILFTNFYANSFRTDRGLTSILSGYPAQPTASIMKYPAKSQSLPGISRS